MQYDWEVCESRKQPKSVKLVNLIKSFIWLMSDDDWAFSLYRLILNRILHMLICPEAGKCPACKMNKQEKKTIEMWKFS